jgi:hypothetical protein
VKRCLLGLAAVVLAAWPAVAVAAGPANVTIRVEGDADTIVPRTALITSSTTLNKDGTAGHDCTGTSAAGALEQATVGNWTGTWSNGLGYSVDAVRGESHTFGSGEFWGLFLNDALASTGICGAELQTGDSVLLAPIAESGKMFGVLSVAGVPATVAPNRPFTVTVKRTTSDFNGGVTHDAVAGATVTAAGATVTTGADGTAQISFGTRGPAGVRASHSGDIRSATEPVCVTTGSDGACGTITPAPCRTTGDDGNCGTKDKRAPRGKIESIREGQHFGKGKGPRALKGVVTADPSGIADVRLRLTRNDHGRCQTFDGRSERLVKLKRCGAKRGKWFSAGDREQWSYLLPSRLGRGRWVLDLQARDKAGNVDALLQRTRTRVVFTVS